jgi:transglutaminase-like putative cysteine protease
VELTARALLPRWPGWRNLPREARDTLFQLGVIGWTVLPHLLHLPWWCSVMVCAVLLWRLQLALANAPLPSRWVVALVLLLAAALTWWGERTLLGKQAGVTMLVVLMSLKMLELRARRDAMVVFFLGFFLVLTHFLYSQSLATALATLLSVWGLLTALVLAHMPVGRPPLRRAAGVAARSALYGMPLMVALFVLFPRFAPLWGLPQDAAGRTGLSGSLRMGGVAEIANDDSIAMRVRYVGNPPPPEALYFRGPVLAAFDGREWTRLTPSFTPAFRQVTDLQLRGTPVRYEVTLEPSRLALLPLLEATPDRPDSAPALPGIETSMRPDLQWQSSQPITERVRFEAQAWPLFRHGPRVPVLGLRDLVALPPGYNPRTLAWAAEFRREPRHAEADARTLANAVLAHIRKNDFSYTLAPGPYGRDAVDEFWLDRKLGFCEHFAASFVVVMRALDVPARIVTGYQGTDPFPVDGYYAVRQSHAHAWAEYWQPGEGWVRADPTAAVAPDRISRSLSLRPVPGFVEQAIGGVSPQLLANLRGLWEAFDNRWNQSVLNFSRNQQYNLLRSLGIDAPNWIDLAYVLIILLCGASLAGAAWALWDRHRQDPWQRLQLQVQSRLRALGVHVGPHDGPGTRARRVRSALGAGAEPLAAALESLERQRYGAGGRSRVDRRWWREFQAAAQRVVTASPMPRRAESTS